MPDETCVNEAYTWESSNSCIRNLAGEYCDAIKYIFNRTALKLKHVGCNLKHVVKALLHGQLCNNGACDRYHFINEKFNVWFIL